jgi:amino acid efflux transporter
VIQRQRASAENRSDREGALGPDDGRNGQDLDQQKPLVACEIWHSSLHEKVVAPGDQIASDDRGNGKQSLLDPGRRLLRVPLDFQPDEDGQAKAGTRPAELSAVAGDDAAGLKRFHAAQARRRRQRNGVCQIDVGYPAVSLQPCHDGPIYCVWGMFGHETQSIVLSTQRRCVDHPNRRHNCHRVQTAFGDGERMALTRTTEAAAAQHLTTSRGAALYIGAIFGPGLLVLPGLAAAEAGPASIIAWLGLLGLSGVFAAVFSALGRNVPSAAGVMGYVTAGLGSRAGRATGWIFLAGVVSGAPIVCLAGASYVTNLTGGGQLIRASVAGALLLSVLGLAAGGLRATAAAQLALVSVLTVVVVVAVAGSAAASRAGNWVPFAPHGWLSVGSAAATLMFSFVGWEAVAPLTTRFADPSRQLPRAVAVAVAVTTALYLSLAAVTISVLGPRAATDAPLARLLSYAVGKAGPYAAAAAAIVLTLGATNAYMSGAAATAGQLVHSAAASGRPAPKLWLLAAVAGSGLALITSYGLGIISIAGLVAVPTTLFLTVYLGAMIAAARMLRGPVRLAALPAAVAVTVMLGFSGRVLAVPAAVALAAGWRTKSGSGRIAIRVPVIRRWPSSRQSPSHRSRRCPAVDEHPIRPPRTPADRGQRRAPGCTEHRRWPWTCARTR